MNISEVKKLYERRPYPHYPLFAKPIWQDGYLGSSRFANLIFNSNLGSDKASILSVGCGEILPYIIRKWETPTTQLSCVDLSSNSLRRAKVRCLFTSGKTDFYCEDINQLLTQSPMKDARFSHIEAFGVLHHISNFETTLRLLASTLDSNGTMRVMVYNSEARNWIWNINRAFRLLGLTFRSDESVDQARSILRLLATKSDSLKTKLNQLGQKSIANNTWFADTFMHPWESRAKVGTWLEAFQSVGLKPIGLFDRYAELDDLENPLWKMPTNSQLSERSKDLRFENNLEVWLVHNKTVTASKKGPSHFNQTIDESDTTEYLWNFMRRMKTPPNNWSKYPETKSLTTLEKWHLWQGWNKAMVGKKDKYCMKVINSLPEQTAQRLARIGAITPAQAEAMNKYPALLKPIHAHMEAPAVLPKSEIPKDIRQKISSKFDHLDPKKFELALSWLQKSL